MMDSADKGKAYDQAIMPIQMVSQVPYFQREERRALLPSITLKEVLDYRDNLKTERASGADGDRQSHRRSVHRHGAADSAAAGR
jgi:hypothetical protein